MLINCIQMYRLIRLNPWQEVTLVELLRWLLRYAHFDWSLIASYVALITSHEVIRTKALNFKMAASRFFGRKYHSETQKRCSQVWRNSLQQKDMIFFAGGMNEPVKFQWKLAAYLDTSNPNNGKKIYNFEFS